MSKPKNAVLLVTGPEGWQPDRVHSMPPSITSARFLGINLTLPQARVVAETFNRAHLPCKGTFHGEWAILIQSLKRMGWLSRYSQEARANAERMQTEAASCAMQGEGGAA